MIRNNYKSEEQNKKNMNNFSEIIAEARFFAKELKKIKDNPPSRIKALRMLLYNWEVLGCLFYIQDQVSKQNLVLEDKDYDLYLKLKNLVPDGHDLTAVFIILERNGIHPSEMTKFPVPIRSGLARLRNVENAKSRIDTYSQNLESFLELTKGYEVS